MKEKPVLFRPNPPPSTSHTFPFSSAADFSESSVKVRKVCPCPTTLSEEAAAAPGVHLVSDIVDKKDRRIVVVDQQVCLSQFYAERATDRR